MSWSFICRPKSMRGLGLQRMRNINLALLAKLGWQMLTDGHTPWIQAIFLGGSPYSSSSWLWKGILHTQPLLKQRFCKLVRNGATINIWHDPWIPTLPSSKPIPRSPATLLNLDDSMATLIDSATKQWDLSHLHLLFDQATITKVLKIQHTLSQ